MASSVRNPSSGDIATLLSKYEDPDSDIRFMTLVDLYNLLSNGSSTFLINDFTTCARTVDQLLKLLDDTNGDVQSQALKWYASVAITLN